MSMREYTDKELLDEISEIVANPGKKTEDQIERDAYFSNPDNAEAVAEQQARMELVIALYKARTEAGLTQRQLAEKMGVSQASVNQIERGRRNLTISVMRRYAAACGKRIALTLL